MGTGTQDVKVSLCLCPSLSLSLARSLSVFCFAIFYSSLTFSGGSPVELFPETLTPKSQCPATGPEPPVSDLIPEIFTNARNPQSPKNAYPLQAPTFRRVRAPSFAPLLPSAAFGRGS